MRKPWLAGTVFVIAATAAASARGQTAPAPAPMAAPALLPPATAPPMPTSGFGYVDRSGLTEHVIRQFSEGLIVGMMYGYAVTSDTSADRVAIRMTAGAVLGGAAGIVIPLVRSRGGREVRSGDVVFVNAAQNWGLAHGFGLPLLFQLEEGRDLSTNQLRLDMGLSATLSLAAGGLAAHLSEEYPVTPGQASALGSAGLWGALGALAITQVVRPEDPGVGWTKVTIGSMLVVADLAMLGAFAARERLDMDRGRVIMIDLGGTGGLLVGLAAAYFIDPSLDNSRVIAGSLLAGGLVGLGTAFLLTETWDEYKQSAPPLVGDGTSLLQYRRGRWGMGAPMPRLGLVPGPGGGSMRPFLSLADGRF